MLEKFNGWTGYTWNKKLFPNPKEFMGWLHEHDLKVALNVHPADPHFMEVYFKELHHPLEEEGVDFWWLDWQQGGVTKIPGLDPLWMLNHYHFLDSSWKGSRPMTFSRYAGVGSHRYPIGFSGDTIVSWESLQFQPYFTNTSSNIGYGWWSHDIGGHMMGIRDDELMARWVQYGVFSPINRLHSSNNLFNRKEPWKFDKITQNVMEEYLRLRHGLIPYLYTMNRRASREGLPLVQPMYYLEPEQEETYEVRNEYYFGSEMLVSPITEKQDPAAKAGKAVTWLPKGLWTDFFSGLIYRGGRMVTLWRGIENIPVLLKAGAIVPMKDMRDYDNSVENPKSMEIRIFPAEDGDFTLWEDAGDTPEDKDENWAATQLTFTSGAVKRFVIGKAKGNLEVVPKERTWKLVFMASTCCTPAVTADGEEITAKVSYERETSSLCVEIPKTSVEKEICISFPEDFSLTENNLSERCFQVLEKAQMEYNLKSKIYEIIQRQGADCIASLAALQLNSALFGALCEILTAL